MEPVVVTGEPVERAEAVVVGEEFVSGKLDPMNRPMARLPRCEESRDVLRSPTMASDGSICFSDISHSAISVRRRDGKFELALRPQKIGSFDPFTIISGCIRERTVKLNSKFVQR